MNWNNATRGLADLLVHSDAAGGFSAAVFGRDGEERAKFCQAAKHEVDLLLPDEAARIDVDLRVRGKDWVWSAALCGLVDGIGDALKERNAAPGEDKAGYRAFHDLSIVERAVAAARKAAAGARARMPDVRAVVSDVQQVLDVAVQRRAEAEVSGSDVAEELSQRDADMLTRLAKIRAIAKLMGIGGAHPHGLAALVDDIGGPHKQLWRAARFAAQTGGLYVLLVVLVIVYGGVIAWELLPVTHWLGPKVVGVDMRPTAAVISWVTALVLLFPGYKRAFVLRRMARSAARRWPKVLEAGRDLLDEEILATRRELAQAQRRCDTTARIGATEDDKVEELMSGVGLGRFIGRLLGAQGGSMERWARTFDGARVDIDTAITRLNADPRSPLRRAVVFMEGLDQRSAEATDFLGLLRYVATLKGLSFASTVDPEVLREAANCQKENPRIEKAVMFMDSSAQAFVAAVPAQEGLDRAFHIGLFAPRTVGEPSKGPPSPPSGAVSPTVLKACNTVADGLSALAPDPHKRRRLVETLRWIRCLADTHQRGALDAVQGSAPGENDMQAVLLLSSVMLGDPDHAKVFFDKLEVTEQDNFSHFIEKDVRPSSSAEDSVDSGMGRLGIESWMGLCRKLLQTVEHTPGAQSIELLHRWRNEVLEAAAGSMPLVHKLPPQPDDD